MSIRKEFAHLKPESPFYPLFEHGMAPILNILVSETGHMEGAGVSEFYRLDVERLDHDQLATIARMVAAQCGGTAEQVRDHMLKEKFIPLRAVHVAAVSRGSMAFL
jgi:hypothetical protein